MVLEVRGIIVTLQEKILHVFIERKPSAWFHVMKAGLVPTIRSIGRDDVQDYVFYVVLFLFSVIWEGLGKGSGRFDREG